MTLHISIATDITSFNKLLLLLCDTPTEWHSPYIGHDVGTQTKTSNYGFFLDCPFVLCFYYFFGCCYIMLQSEQNDIFFVGPEDCLGFTTQPSGYNFDKISETWTVRYIINTFIPWIQRHTGLQGHKNSLFFYSSSWCAWLTSDNTECAKQTNLPWQLSGDGVKSNLEYQQFFSRVQWNQSIIYINSWALNWCGEGWAMIQWPWGLQVEGDDGLSVLPCCWCRCLPCPLQQGFHKESSVAWPCREWRIA